MNFEDYVDYVRQDAPPAPFVEYIYGRSPGRALIVFYRAIVLREVAIKALAREAAEVEAARQQLENQDEEPPRKIPQQPFEGQSGEILLAEKIISHAIALKKWDNGKLLPDAKEQLVKLSEHNQWWVRLYVAKIMRHHPELRQADVLDKLSDDSNASVSKAVKSIKE